MTGRALVKHISRALDHRLWTGATRRLGLPAAELRALADAWNESFDEGRPLERTLREIVESLIERFPSITSAERDHIVDIVRRFTRTDTFLRSAMSTSSPSRASSLVHDTRPPTLTNITPA
jgi:hypothetical protein